jgi:membrane protein implicated in regulation of membrane protease activity
MKLLNSPRKLFWIGLACVVLGFVLPFMIVLGFINNSFALTFVIYTLQLVGLLMGVVAAAGFAMDRRRKDKLKKQAEAENQEEESTIGWME